MATNKIGFTQIVLSGVESDRFYETAYNFAQTRSMLLSYLYIGNKGNQWFAQRAAKHKDVRFMLDSGAHSFRTEGYCPKWPDLAHFEDYVARYRDWIITNKDLTNLVVNLDIDNVVGMAKMQEWDNEIFRPIERQGVPVCYVWHENYGFDYWLQMCREHEYVGLPGHLSEADWHKMMRPAMMNGCRVHGFAATKGFILGHIPLASADSISWKSGEMYGQTFVFENGSLRVYDKNQKEERKRYKARWVAEGIDWDLLEQDKAEPITQVCALAWRDYQAHVATVTPKLAYWMKTSKAVDDLGDIDLLSKDEIIKFYADQKFHLEVKSESEARADLKTIRAFLARDNTVVMSMTDEVITAWVKRLGATPENDTRSEKEAAIRQHLYPSFYKINAGAALPRLTEEDVTPGAKRSLSRYETLRPCPTVETDLPEESSIGTDPGEVPGDGSQESHPRLNAPGTPVLTHAQPPNSNAENTTESGPSSPDSGLASPEIVPLTASQMRAQVKVDTTFADGVSDPITRLKVGLGVELAFHQHKLRYEADGLKIRKREVRRQKLLLQQVRKMADELTTISELAGEELSRKMIAAGQDAFDRWLNAGSKAAIDDEARQRAAALRPQNQITPAKAREMGKLGGAPKGNQNGRKHGLYSAKLPNLACDNCPHIQVCPQYKAGHVCAYLNEFTGWEQDRQASELRLLEDIVQQQGVRVRRGLLFETFEGGIASREVNKMMGQFASFVKMLHGLRNPSLPHIPGQPHQASAAPGEPPKKGLMEQWFGIKDAEATVVNHDGSETPAGDK